MAKNGGFDTYSDLCIPIFFLKKYAYIEMLLFLENQCNAQ
jgi:hypothetical protein